MPLAELIQAAMAAADELGSDELHAEHLFAGLLACEGPAREALEACGVTRRTALDAAEHLGGSEKDRGETRYQRASSRTAIATRARAEGLAIGLGAVTVEPEHVLMAIMWSPTADWFPYLLKGLGATPATVLAELRKRGVATPVVPLPEPVAWGQFVRVTREEFERLTLEARAAKRLYRFNYQGADVLVSFQEAE